MKIKGVIIQDRGMIVWQAKQLTAHAGESSESRLDDQIPPEDARQYNLFPMKIALMPLLASILSSVTLAQSAPHSVTVPITLDHNRIVVDVYFPMADGSKMRVRGWVDNGNAELAITEGLAKKLGLEFTTKIQKDSGNPESTVRPPRELLIGNMLIRVTDVKKARVTKSSVVAPGMSAEINLPAPVLRHYDVLFDFPNREFTIAAPGSLHFEGTPVKALLNAQNGLIQIPATIEGDSHNMALDVGSTVSFLSTDLIDHWLSKHAEWPHMKGAVGPANMWGMAQETSWEVVRIPRMEYGGIILSNVVTASFPTPDLKWFEQRAGVPTAGLIGADALLNDRVGVDFAHHAAYFQQLSKYVPSEFDVVGLILRPESDGRYTVLGVADYEAKPAVPEVKSGDVLVSVDGGRARGATMGQVWSLLEGSPGTIRNLVLERDGKQFTVKATVRRFLGTTPKNN